MEKREEEVLKGRNQKLDTEFILKIGETVTIENIEIYVIKNLVNSVKGSEINTVKNGIKMKVTKEEDSQEYDFIDGEETRVIIGDYALEIKNRIPGQGTFVLYKI